MLHLYFTLLIQVKSAYTCYNASLWNSSSGLGTKKASFSSAIFKARLSPKLNPPLCSYWPTWISLPMCHTIPSWTKNPAAYCVRLWNKWCLKFSWTEKSIAWCLLLPVSVSNVVLCFCLWEKSTKLTFFHSPFKEKHRVGEFWLHLLGLKKLNWTSCMILMMMILMVVVSALKRYMRHDSSEYPQMNCIWNYVHTDISFFFSSLKSKELSPVIGHKGIQVAVPTVPPTTSPQSSSQSPHSTEHSPHTLRKGEHLYPCPL